MCEPYQDEARLKSDQSWTLKPNIFILKALWYTACVLMEHFYPSLTRYFSSFEVINNTQPMSDSMVGFPLKIWACLIHWIFFSLGVFLPSQTSPIEPGICFSIFSSEKRRQFRTMVDVLKVKIYCPNTHFDCKSLFIPFDPTVYFRMHTFIFKSLNL